MEPLNLDRISRNRARRIVPHHKVWTPHRDWTTYGSGRAIFTGPEQAKYDGVIRLGSTVSGHYDPYGAVVGLNDAALNVGH